MNNKILDLTKVLDKTVDIYQGKDYQDPPFIIEPWCEVKDQSYKVSKISMGTQMGTHIDAPSHFSESGKNLDTISIENLIGPYFLIDIDATDTCTKANIEQNYNNQKIILLKCIGKDGVIPESIFNSLLNLNCPVWVLAGDIKIGEKPEFYFNQTLAEKNIFLVENLDLDACNNIKPHGIISTLPLNLKGVSGAPCRVVITYEK